MHCLEVIKAKNEKAAAREEAHAFNDRQSKRQLAIAAANQPESITSRAYRDAYMRARQEG